MSLSCANCRSVLQITPLVSGVAGLSASSRSKVDTLNIWCNKRLCYGRGTARRACQYIETRVPDLSCGIICVILRLTVFIQYRSVTDTHTQTNRRTDRHTTTACTALSIASRGKNRPYCTAHHHVATFNSLLICPLPFWYSNAFRMAADKEIFFPRKTLIFRLSLVVAIAKWMQNLSSPYIALPIPKKLVKIRPRSSWELISPRSTTKKLQQNKEKKTSAKYVDAMPMGGLDNLPPSTANDVTHFLPTCQLCSISAVDTPGNSCVEVCL